MSTADGLPRPFPFTALVGVDDLKLALVLASIDPRIGGVLLRGHKGSAKTTAARGLAALLPGDAPFVELPLGATEDRVVGSFDVRAALGTGEYRFRPGLLETADGGVLYVDEVNLLADHLVDLLLDAAATGVVRVERDGVSEVRRARFVLVGSMNPEEGELRPQLLDRFGLSATVGAHSDATSRAEAVRRRLEYDRDPEAMWHVWAGEERALARRLTSRGTAQVPSALTEHVAALCAAAGAEGLRADLAICRAASALAQWEGRTEATPDDVARVAPLALAHRRRTPWEPLDAIGPGGAPPTQSRGGAGGAGAAGVRGGQGPHGAQGGPGAEGGPGSEGGPGGLGAQSGLGGLGAQGQHGSEGGGGAHEGAPGRAAGSGASSRGEEDGEGPGRGRDGAVARSSSADAADVQGAPGRRRSGATLEAEHGRLVGSRSPTWERGPGSLHPAASLLASASRPREAGPLRVEADDLREAVRQKPASSLVVMVVDASGSMGVRRRLEAARSAALALLVDAYQHRDRVALVTFRGNGADVLLRPTASTEIARARLETLPTGGRTPLAAGIRTGLELALSRRRAVDRPLLVVVSDGRATWAEGGENPVEAGVAAARAVKAAGVESLLVDCESADPARRLGLVDALADAMGARVVRAGEMSGDTLALSVRAALALREDALPITS